MDYFEKTRGCVQRMKTLLLCAKCLSIPKELYIVYKCCHKYCEKCIPRSEKGKTNEKCSVCNSKRIAQELTPDTVTTNILKELLKFEENLSGLEKQNNSIEIDNDVEVVEVVENENKCDSQNGVEILSRIEVKSASNGTVSEIEQIKTHNNFDDDFQDPFDSDDPVVETQIRRSHDPVKPKRIFASDNPKKSHHLSNSDQEVVVPSKTRKLTTSAEFSLKNVKSTSINQNQMSSNGVKSNQKNINFFDSDLSEDDIDVLLPETGKTIRTGTNDLKNGEVVSSAQSSVNSKNKFFKSKERIADDSIPESSARNDVQDQSASLSNGKNYEGSFLNEILNPPKDKRVPFKPLKTYTPSSKPKTKPRLNLHANDSDNSEDGVFSTPQPPVNKKSDNPPELTPYTNKTYSPVRKQKRPKTLADFGPEAENTVSSSKENGSKNKSIDDDSSGEKVFDFDVHSPSPPPLTPYPEPQDKNEKELSVSTRPKRMRTTVRVGSNVKSDSSVSSESNRKTEVPKARKNSELNSRTIRKRESIVPTTTKKPVVSAQVRRKSSVVTVTDTPVPGSSSSSSCLTPGASLKRNAAGETPLHIASRKGDIKKVEELIKSGVDVDAVDYNGYTALHEAINSRSKLKNNVKIAKVLCDAGCNVNLPAGDFKETPLHEAATIGDVSMVDLLLSHKASPNIRTARGSLARDLTTSEKIKKLIDNSLKDEQIDPSSEEVDDPAVLKVQSKNAVIFFAFQPPEEIIDECRKVLKIKISNQLREGVTHIVFPNNPNNLKGKGVRTNFNFEYLYGLLSGAWMVSASWINDALNEEKFTNPKDYEILGCEPSTLPDDNLVGSDGAPKRARLNKALGNPGLFHGMNFLLYKSTAFKNVSKKDLGKLISAGNGVVINREPNPDAVDPMENPIRFHAQDNANFVLTSHVILFDQSNEPTKKFNMEHVKSLNIKWLIASALSFKLLDPEDYIN